MSKRWNEGLGDWASSLRFSGFTVLIVALVVLGALIISPTLTTFIQQQRELAELRVSVQLQRDAVDDTDAERLKWQDPTYVRAQARGRLFYVLPGETQLSVIEDVIIPEDAMRKTNDELTLIEQNWARALVVSMLHAGVTSSEPATLTDRLLGIHRSETPENFVELPVPVEDTERVTEEPAE